MAASESWESLRRQTRTQANQLEQALTSYSKLAAQASTSYASSGKVSLTGSETEVSKSLEEELSSGLTKVGVYGRQ